jgi:hypothetical protein
MGSDTNSGTKTVKIGGEQVGIKNNSDYKTSKGNEAATRSFGMNVISHTISGKMQHAAWSMDVKYEGENAIRMMDLTTHNHGSQSGGAVTQNVGAFKAGSRATTCEELDGKIDEATEQAHPRSQNQPVGTTMAAAQYNPPTGAGYSTTSYSHMADAANTDGMATGSKGKDGDFKPTKMCDEGKKKLAPKYSKTGRQPNQGPMCHAESRIVEGLFSGFGSSPGGTLTLKIRWKTNNQGLPRDSPCEDHCQDMLCAAKACGLKIMICKNGKDKPTELEC